MGPHRVLPLLLLLLSVANAQYRNQRQFSPNGQRDTQQPTSTTVSKDSLFCLPCVVFAKVLSLYPNAAATALNMICMSLNLGGPCSGTGQMFLGALQVGGSRHACSLIHFCKSDGDALEVPSGLRPITDELGNAASGIRNATVGAASLLGSTVRQTASGLGSLISGGSDFAGNLAGSLVPVFGSSLKDIIGGTGRYFGSLSERLGGGIGDILDGNFGGSQQSRRKRSPLTTAEQEAKEFLDKFDFRVGPQASEVAKAFEFLAQSIKEKTLQAIKKKEDEKQQVSS